MSFQLLIGPPPFGALRIAYKYVPWKWDLNAERARVRNDAGDNRRILIHYNLHHHETVSIFRKTIQNVFPGCLLGIMPRRLKYLLINDIPFNISS